MRRKGYSEKTFTRISLIIMILIAIICLLPFLMMFSASITEENELIKEGYKFFPRNINFNTYIYLWAQKDTILQTIYMSFIVTGVGVLACVIMSSMFAYPLSRPDFKYRNVFAFIMFFTMLFNGGMTAQYIVMTRLFDIRNSLWAYILPGMFGNVLMIRNYYTASIPYSIQEAARIDGATEMKIYWKIILPLSKPIMVTTALFAGMGYWNNWSAGLYYITEPRLYTLTVYLNKLMNNISQLKGNAATQTSGINLSAIDFPSAGIRMAIALISIIPIILIFPWAQKHLVKGIVIGGVKG